MIKITNISKTFSGNQVLNDISLEIEEGDVVALIGASGAGKSTFLRGLNDLERPDSGQIEIDDLKIDYSIITKQEVLELRRKTGMVFQQFNLFERRTALENVMEGLIQVKKLSKAEATVIADAELDKVGLTDRKDYYPKFLSGGQKQRVGIARALAMQPKLLTFRMNRHLPLTLN
ncbi:L-cystine import ATP-binding protein TcyC [Lactococcus lactis]|nr:L-cystine import ATP-binding protein TcyC [Lactococcus lactis]